MEESTAKPMSKQLKHASPVEGPPIVIDNGATCKAGFSGESLPRALVSSARLDGELKIPMHCGIVSDWDAMEQVWHHIFYDQLKVAPEEHPVLVTEAPIGPKANRERMTQIMFETFNVLALYVHQQAVLALYASGRTSGVVLDSGDGVSHVVVIYEGYLLPHAARRVDLAGHHLTAWLQRRLRERGHALSHEAARALKEAHGRVALDFEEEVLEGLAASAVERRGAVGVASAASSEGGGGNADGGGGGAVGGGGGGGGGDGANGGAAAQLMALPDELIERTLSGHEPATLVRLSRCCRALHERHVPHAARALLLARAARPDGAAVFAGAPPLTPSAPVGKPAAEQPSPHRHLPELYQCSEALFRPQLAGLDAPGLHEAVRAAILSCDVDVHFDLWDAIVLAGGCTRLAGLASRLARELSALRPRGREVRVIAPAERQHSVWMGGSILSSLSTFQGMWISRREYELSGPSIVHRKCF